MNPRKAILFFVGQMVLFGLESVVVHRLAGAVPIAQVALARSIGVLCLAFTLYGRASLDIFRTKVPALQLLRGMITLGTTWTLIYCFTALPLAAAASLFYLTTFFMTGLGVLTTKEVVPRARWLGLAIGWVGALVILRPAFDSLEWALLLALVGAAGNAVALMMNQQLDKTDSPITIPAYVGLVGLVGNLPWALMSPVPDPSSWQWLALMMTLGPVGFYFGIPAVRYGGLSLLAPWTYLRLVFAALFGALLFSEIPDAWAMVGAALVCASLVVGRKPVVGPSK